VLRPAQAADLSFLTAVTRRLGEVPVPGWRNAAEVAAADLNQIKAFLAEPREDALLLVAEQSPDHPVGCLFVATEADFFTGLPNAHIEVVAVAPEAEGQGLARLLIEAGENWARTRGMTHATLNVFVDNSHARAVYQRLGYSPETIRYRKPL
jgi:ribosomal protein S18 acetylase RimI-like enzyme